MGAPYNGPVPIPADGGLLRVLAEDGDISAEKSFDFLPQRRGMGEKPLTLARPGGPGRPASLLKRIERTDTQGAFELMNQIEFTHAQAFGAVLTVGTRRCQRHAAHRPRIPAAAGAAIKRAADLLRELVGDERAPVTLRLERLDFTTGADLLALVDALHEPVESPADHGEAVNALSRKPRPLKPAATTGFGCPAEMFVHHVLVTIPRPRRRGAVRRGLGCRPGRGPDRMVRCALPRSAMERRSPSSRSRR